MSEARAEPGLASQALIAAGDFACNLYWQSVSFFLLIFYTDGLKLAPGTAGAILAAGLVANGIGDVAVGYWAERSGKYRAFILWGAVPLGLAFAAIFLLPPGSAVAWVVAAHLVFRLLYVVVNIPYAALSAQVTRSSRIRARIAAGRMLFGTAAALVVAAVMRLLVQAMGSQSGVTHGYAIGAAGFAILGTAILLGMAAALPRDVPPPAGRPGDRARLRTLAGNRAFVTLLLASGAAAVGGGVLNGAVVYYFAYVAHAPHAGPIAVGWMGTAGAIAIPFWLALRDRIGTRAMWLAGAGLALLVTAAFALAGGRGVIAGIAYFGAMQVALLGLGFAFWAMLPDTVEWGEHRSAVRVEALAFGAAALGQKLALALAGLLLGAIFQRAGYTPGAAQAPATVAAIRLAIIVLPALGVALSALAILANPLRRDTHARIAAPLG